MSKGFTEIDYHIKCFNCGHVWTRSEAGHCRLCPECKNPFVEAKITGFK